MGLRGTDRRVDDLSWDFGSRDAFAAWCAVGFGGWTVGLTPEEGSAFVTDVFDAYAANTARPGLPVHPAGRTSPDPDMRVPGERLCAHTPVSPPASDPAARPGSGGAKLPWARQLPSVERVCGPGRLPEPAISR